MRGILLGLVFGLLIMGQAAAKQVLYDNATRQAEDAPAFFMDRAGELYPPAAVKLDNSIMDVTGGDSPYVSNSDPAFALLRSLYEWKSTRPRDRDWPALLAHVGVTSSGEFKTDWVSVQDILRRDAAKRITDLGKEHDDVILLVHGYNNGHTAANGWYRHTEQMFREAAATHGRRIAFVRMYWDGLDGKTPFFIWTKAQYNGYLVGLELRRILSLVDGATPLRMFTHSSGAFVVTNALGDGSASAQLHKLPSDYPDKAAGRTLGYEPPTHLRNLRVAMLIPAQPTTAFAHYFRQPDLRNPGVLIPDPAKKAALPERLILGLSKHDLATSKTFLAPCTFLGATCMAVRVDETCHQVANDLNARPPQLQVVNFVQWPIHPHNVYSYTDDEEWPQLTRALLATDPGPPTGTETLCPPPVSTTASS